MLRLNSISDSVFNATETDKVSIKVNSAGTSKTLNRQSIVSTGRLVVCEYFGREVNKRPNQIEKYNSRMEAKGLDYASVSRKFNEKKLLFCAAQVDKMLGKEEGVGSFEDFKKNASFYGKNPLFFQVLGAIEQDIISPLFFDVLNDVGMGLLQLDTVPLGGTKEITVRSNDIFLFEDGSWGSSRSTSKNYLYAKTITLTPKVYEANATIKWYQDIVNGDAGWYYRAIFNGMYSKMYSKLIGLMKTAVGDVSASPYSSAYIPSGLVSPTYTSANWIRITDLVAAANGVQINDLMAIGTRSSLSQVLPVDGNGGAITGLQYGLGQRWFENGYLPNAGGIDLFPVTPAIVPGTQNSTLDTIDTGSDIYILAKGGNGYRPIYGVVPEGNPIMLTATPNAGNANGTADFTIDINVQAMFDFAPVFATKVGVVRSVYPAS